MAYTILSDSWRRIHYGVKHTYTDCDKGEFKASWYRFQFPGTPLAKIPTLAPLPQYVQADQQTCGTNAPAWMEESPPLIGDPPKDVTFNFAWGANTKDGSADGKVVACAEGGETMFLYYLPQVPMCTRAYCALEYGEKTSIIT